jgi:hypothetical protein
MRLAIHIIAQAKKYVASCGGSTQAMAIGEDGMLIDMSPQLIAQYETATSLIVEDLAKVIFFATDPVMTGLDGEKLKAAIEAGVAQWGAQLPLKVIGMLGLPPAMFAQHQVAAAAPPPATTAPDGAKPEPDSQPSSPTNSPTDQT